MNPAVDVNDILRMQLEAISEVGSDNQLTPAEIRDFALDYLNDWDEEIASFPEVGREQHWALWMADHDPTRDGVFAVMVFNSAGLEVVCGRGTANLVRRFSESEAPEKVSRVIPEVVKRFVKCSQLETVPRKLAESWLGRPVTPNDQTPTTAIRSVDS